MKRRIIDIKSYVNWWEKKQKQEKESVINVHKKVKVGIAFGGGGARGVGHIGAIKALEELGIKADYVAGTSVGSMIGSLYSAGFSYNDIIEKLKTLRAKDIRDSKLIWRPSNSENIEQLLVKIFGKDLVFSELKTPLSIVAVNIKDGEEVKITSGSVAKASSGSCAVPGIFSPVVYNDMHLVDGGLKNNVPADVVRDMGADIVIAIDVNPTRGEGTDSLKILDVLKGSLGIMMQANVQEKLKYADVVVKPNLARFSSSKIDNIEEMIKEGYDAVMNKKEELINALTKKPKKKVKSLWEQLNDAK